MSAVTIGNHSAVVMPRQDRDRIRKCYCDVLGCTITRESAVKDDFRLGEGFYVGVLYGDVTDESEFLRSGRSIYLELKSDQLEETQHRIIDSGVRVLEVPDPHLYFQAPGGQVFRLVGINEDLTAYESGPDPGSAPVVVRRAEQSSNSTNGAKPSEVRS